jgi:hypothetical protein
VRAVDRQYSTAGTCLSHRATVACLGRQAQARARKSQTFIHVAIRGSKGEPALSMSQRKERLVLHIAERRNVRHACKAR